MNLVEKYMSDFSGGDILNSIKIHANIATINTKYIGFQGVERIVVYNVFKAALSQNKLENLLETIDGDNHNSITPSLNLHPRLDINNCAKYIFIGNAFVDTRYDLVKGYIVNPLAITKRVIIRLAITGSDQESYVSLDLPGNSNVEIPKLQIPRFNTNELNLIKRSISPATITLKLFLAGEDGILDVFQAQTLVSQPDFVLIARELEDGTIEDHSHILSWLVNSGASGIGKFIETWVMPQIGKSTGYLAGKDFQDSKSREFARKQAMAVYEGLKALKLSYMPTELLTTDRQEKMILQRVQNPENLFLMSSTYLNCLDGAILFSSIIERLNLDPIIILIPGHSIVGWKSYPNADCEEFQELMSMCEFLDITLASDNLDFYSAMSAAEAYLIKYSSYLKSPSKRLEEYVKIVDVKLSRKISS